MADQTLSQLLRRLQRQIRRRIQRHSSRHLSGQCCDRLRPSFVGRALGQALLVHTAPGADLVDWNWDALRQRVSGVLLQNNELRRFRWWPLEDRFELRAAIVRLQPMLPAADGVWAARVRRRLG